MNSLPFCAARFKPPLRGLALPPLRRISKAPYRRGAAAPLRWTLAPLRVARGWPPSLRPRPRRWRGVARPARKRPRHYAAPEAGAAEGADRLRRSPFSRPLGRARSTAHKGRRVLRSTAPENSPKTPENSPKSEFSTPWKKFFHCVEKSPKVFPLCGKNGPFFPQCGKYFSIAWKNREKVFHTVENLGPSDGFRLAFGRVALLDSKLF